jgi:hypothetical protein
VRRSFGALLLWVAGLVAPVNSVAHEGHDHGAPPPPVSATIAPRADASSSDFEVVLVARGGELEVYLDDFRTNAQIAGAEVEIDSPAGLLKPTARAAGVYVVAAPFLDRPGSYDLAISISAGGVVDVLTATLKIPQPPPVAAAPAGPWSWLADPALAADLKQRVSETVRSNALPFWLALAGGFAAGLLAGGLIWRRRSRTAAAVGLVVLAPLLAVPAARAESPSQPVTRDVAQRFPDGALFVPKPTQHILGLRTVMTAVQSHRRTVELPGRVVPSPNASGLVQASVGGRLLPPAGGFKPLGTRVKAGDILAYVRPPLPLADATAQQQQARELDQQISIVTRKVERLRSIERVIAKSQLEDAELELSGLTTRRSNLERAGLEPEALQSPVDGVIAAANAVAGQMAEPNAVIFQIVDPAVLWVEALSYDAFAASGVAEAALADGRTVGLEYLGTGLADRNQAVPIHFAITGAAGGLRAGQFVTVLASIADERRGISLPRQAVLRGGNGQSIVFEHTNAERFVARELRVEPLDGAHVLVVAGLEAGRRIVTQGAELLGQIR